MIHRRLVILAVALIALCSGCAHVRLVAEYDEKTLEESLRVGKRVDAFYGTIVELSPAKRTYSQFAADYVDIGADIYSLVQRNAARPLNDESTQIAQDILDFWRAYQQKHKEKNAYADARFDRRRFERLFRAAVSAEAVKDLKPDDEPPPSSEDD